MSEFLTLCLAFLTMLIAMAGFALSLPAHWKQAGFSLESPKRRLRLFGWSGMGLSALLCLSADHPSMAVLVWIMLIPVCAMITAVGLTYRPQWLRVLGNIAGGR